MLSYEDEDEGKDGNKIPDFQLIPTFSGEMFRREVQFGVLVEIIYGRGLGGSQKRRYREQFTQAEHRTISRWITKFYRWEMITGVPKRVALKMKTLELLKRAVAFYAGA